MDEEQERKSYKLFHHACKGAKGHSKRTLYGVIGLAGGSTETRKWERAIHTSIRHNVGSIEIIA